MQSPRNLASKRQCLPPTNQEKQQELIYDSEPEPDQVQPELQDEQEQGKGTEKEREKEHDQEQDQEHENKQPTSPTFPVDMVSLNLLHCNVLLWDSW